MFYDTHYRHNDALSPDALGTIPTALHALNVAFEDCRRAGRMPARDASVLLLIRNLADVAERGAPSISDLRLRCALDRSAVIAAPALLDIAGHDISDDPIAKRTFHNQVRRALKNLLEAVGLDPDGARVNTVFHNDRDEGTTEARHPDIAIRVVPRAFLGDTEFSFNRCRNGQDYGKYHRAPIGELADAVAFQRRLTATIGDAGAPRLAAAA